MWKHSIKSGYEKVKKIKCILEKISGDDEKRDREKIDRVLVEIYFDIGKHLSIYPTSYVLC